VDAAVPPPHIKAIRGVAKCFASFDVGRPKMWLSGLEDMKVEDQHNHLGMPSERWRAL
jgi:5-methyltetrahydrofolate--homocysteine methyltransferase